MKIKSGFIVEKVGSRYLAVAVGERADDFNALIRMNGTGAFIWNSLAECNRSEEELVGLLVSEFDVSRERAAADVSAFVTRLAEAGLLDE